MQKKHKNNKNYRPTFGHEQTECNGQVTATLKAVVMFKMVTGCQQYCCLPAHYVCGMVMNVL